MSRWVDPVLVALSDCLVVTALERGWTRAVPRSERAKHLAVASKSTGYISVPIHEHRIDKALDGAWDQCARLVVQHELDVAADAWTELLDSYTRSLIMMSQPHRIAVLATFLGPISSLSPQAREFLAVI